MPESILPSSFRDPSGFLFLREEVLYRQVNEVYRDEYDRLLESGLYDQLTRTDRLIPHEEAALSLAASLGAYRVLRPRVIPFVSYPYEWCFSQLKDAALLTLEVQQKAVEHGLSLKDASAYNVQFDRGRPVFIDTLSFERYREGRPWVAYRQFCQHFLAPLALMSYCDVRLNQFFRTHLDGVPLDLASSLLPFATRLRLPLLMHLHLHASAQRRFAGRPVNHARTTMSRSALLGLVESLAGAVRGLRWTPNHTEWAGYYQDTNYSPQGLAHRKRIVVEFLRETAPRSVWDLGGNVGLFSRIASDQGIFTLCLDADAGAVEKNYRTCVERRETHLLPLLQDLTNPSGGIGWGNQERLSLEARGPANSVLALALVHHLAMGNNLPLARIAERLSRLGRHLLIEFVPKNDSQVRRMLRNREDIFSDYTREGFEKAFQEWFDVHGRENIPDSERILFRMQSRVTP